ncbi:hypothetical protein [Azohydromonas lata]|uniref:hypothetical protein n=1 Tax=Azohydromonas lata TaxID=45677 RepID=UPI000836FB15|nr:hypothetical protein [Azohydromonas lata]
MKVDIKSNSGWSLVMWFFVVVALAYLIGHALVDWLRWIVFSPLHEQRVSPLVLRLILGSLVLAIPASIFAAWQEVRGFRD